MLKMHHANESCVCVTGSVLAKTSSLLCKTDVAKAVVSERLDWKKKHSANWPQNDMTSASISALLAKTCNDTVGASWSCVMAGSEIAVVEQNVCRFTKQL